MKRSLALALILGAAALSLPAQVPVTVVSGASFRPNFPVAPMSYVQVYGNFAGFPTQNADLGQLPLPTDMSGVQVQIDGVASPLYAISDQLCAFNVPQATSAGRHQIRVMRDNQVVGQGDIDVIAKSPGIFFGFSNDGQTRLGGVRRGVDNAYALEASPVSKGDAIIIALTGEGTDLTAPVADGQAPMTLIRTLEDPKVYLGNIELTDLIFSGPMPLFPGLWQINVTIPADFPVSGPVALIVMFDGLPSNEVIIWVQ